MSCAVVTLCSLLLNSLCQPMGLCCLGSGVGWERIVQQLGLNHKRKFSRRVSFLIDFVLLYVYGKPVLKKLLTVKCFLLVGVLMTVMLESLQL